MSEVRLLPATEQRPDKQLFSFALSFGFHFIYGSLRVYSFICEQRSLCIIEIWVKDSMWFSFWLQNYYYFYCRVHNHFNYQEQQGQSRWKLTNKINYLQSIKV